MIRQFSTFVLFGKSPFHSSASGSRWLDFFRGKIVRGLSVAREVCLILQNEEEATCGEAVSEREAYLSARYSHEPANERSGRH